jgi:hypothetical protein
MMFRRGAEVGRLYYGTPAGLCLLWNRRKSRICNQLGDFANELFVSLDLTDTATYHDLVGAATGNQQEGEVFVPGLTHQRHDLSLRHVHGNF